MRSVLPFFILLGALPPALWACGSNVSGGTSAGGSDSAGTSPGGSSASTGGSSAGGSSAGQANVGGASSGGAAPGSAGTGVALGGSGPAASGGAASGGAASGGAASGGAASGGAATGGAASGGAAGSTGTGNRDAICNFASGLNIAWVNFAHDIPNPNLATFNKIFKDTHDNGGRVIRWWLHTDGTITPGYDKNGMTNPIPQSHIDGIKSVLAAAHSAGVAIDLSLWSFDMLQGGYDSNNKPKEAQNLQQAGNGDGSTPTYEYNLSLLQNDANRKAYIVNYLTPLVTALKGTPGLYSYEIFNEPEGMTSDAGGWATYKTSETYIQKTVNQFAAAIHAADPSALVTNGAQTFGTCSNVSGKQNRYSDAALKAAGGEATGTLDFYEVHYYTSNGVDNSAFTHPASYWKLDKKLVLGEFFAADTDGVSMNNTFTYLYTNGYNGAWAWSYDADQVWPSMQVPMQDVATAHADVLTCAQN